MLYFPPAVRHGPFCCCSIAAVSVVAVVVVVDDNDMIAVFAAKNRAIQKVKSSGCRCQKTTKNMSK